MFNLCNGWGQWAGNMCNVECCSDFGTNVLLPQCGAVSALLREVGRNGETTTTRDPTIWLPPIVWV